MSNDSFRLPYGSKCGRLPVIDKYLSSQMIRRSIWQQTTPTYTKNTQRSSALTSFTEFVISASAKRNGFWSMDTSPARTVEKTRRYKIRLNDVIDYLLTLEAAPDLVATPVGAFNVKRKQLNPVAQICQKEFQRFLYNIWTDEADILRISDVQVLLGYSAGTIRQWILRKELRSTRLPCGIQVTAKEWLIDFTVRYTIKNSSHLSITHRKLVEQHFCDCSQKCN